MPPRDKRLEGLAVTQLQPLDAASASSRVQTGKSVEIPKTEREARPQTALSPREFEGKMNELA